MPDRDKHFYKSYSQEGEDMLLRSFFECHAPGYKGFYVDVGAYHPTRFSNTSFFYENGWNGINIDATPGSMEAFRKERDRDTNLEIGISNGNKELTFYCFNEPALNGFSKELSIEREENTHFKIIKEINISTHPLKEILDIYLPKNKKIDFLSIDGEGMDFDVLISNDWKKYLPDFILVEDTKTDLEKLSESMTFKFLKEKQYKLVGKTKRTMVFQKELT